MGREGATRRKRWAIGLLAACGSLLAGSALAAFPQDPPNDPAYDPAEQGGPSTCLTRSADSEQHYLYSFMPQCTPGATDPENAAGGSEDRAWAKYTPGNGHTVIAYIEGGINWRNQPSELANKVFLNAGELPAPTTPKKGRKLCPGALCAADYSDTKDANGNGVVDPEDIIVRYSDGVDDDHNGYTDDISGWDFYNDQNDPATVDSRYDHANGQQRQAAAQTNNGVGDAGVCPGCMVMPIKAGAEALDRTDDLAQAWLYAADMQVDVLVSVTADVGYSTFMRQAVNYCWRHNVVMVQASNDFESTDHQGGMFWPHVLPGNGLVSNAAGLSILPNGAAVGNGATTTYRARSAFTSFGPHNMFSVATQGGTTSESTPTVGGTMALVLAEGKRAARRGQIKRPLTNEEAIQVVRATSSDITTDPNPPLGWPAKPGFDPQFGYGRPNVYKAMKAVSKGQIPPEAWIDAPRWYSLYDPTRKRSVPVRGFVGAPRSKHYSWKLQFAPGAEPGSGDYTTAASGHGSKPFEGKLGSIDLAKVPQPFWDAAYHLSSDKTLETSEQYTVTIRLRVTDARGRLSEERRTIAVHHDPTLRRGFPKRIGAGGESQPALADLRGSGKEDVILGDADGRVHALSPRGRELSGFPVHTLATRVTKQHPSVNPGHEPIFGNVAVGDLFHNGRQEIVATSTTGRTYVWGARGKLLRGWPKKLDTGVHKPKIPRPDEPFTRPAIMGATAPPVLANLDSDPQLEIVQSAWDGRIHAWNPGGSRVKGFPVHATLPPGTPVPSGQVTINDQKLDLPPALAQLDGDKEPELVQRLQYAFANGAGLQVPFGGESNVVAYNPDGSRVPGFLISGQALAFYYGSAQEFITEGVNNPTTADINGDGKTEIASAAGIFSPTTLYNPDGSQDMVYGPLPGATLSLLFGNPTGILNAFNGTLPDDAPVNFTTSGAFGHFGPGGQLSYVEPGSGGASVAGSLLLAGSGIPIVNYMRGFNATSGAEIPGMPSRAQGLDFLGAPAVADVNGDGSPDVIEGGDSSALHAFTSDGTQAAGFPKFTTGWVLFGPAVGDLNSDGRNDVVAATREGYVMAWKTKGKASANNEWWGYRHDERNTGMYGVDTRPPGELRKAHLNRADTKLRFEAPGDDWYAGKVDHYRIQFGNICGPGKPRHRRVAATAAAGHRQTVKAPHGNLFSVQAVDEAGNVGRRWRSHIAVGCPAQPVHLHVVKLAADPKGGLAYDKSRLRTRPGLVKLRFTNRSPVVHRPCIENANGRKLGCTKDVVKGRGHLDAKLKPGKYTYFCSVDGHRAAGMKGTLRVKRPGTSRR